MIKEKIVKGRKEYECVKCNAKIEKGEQHISRTIADGKIRTERQCLNCKDSKFLIWLFVVTSGLLAVAIYV
jgi:hypothetical protein